MNFFNAFMILEGKTVIKPLIFLIMILVVLIVSPTSQAGDYERFFEDGDWHYDTNYHGGVPDDPYFGYAESDVDGYWGRLFVAANTRGTYPATADYEAYASLKAIFGYFHHDWLNMFEFTYSLNGRLKKQQAINEFYVKFMLIDTTVSSIHDTVYTRYTRHRKRTNYEFDHDTVKTRFGYVLEENHLYKATAAAYAYVRSDAMWDSARVDFFNDDPDSLYRVDFDSLKFRHTHDTSITEGGAGMVGTHVEETYYIAQDDFDYADRLDFYSFNNHEDDCDINYWKIIATDSYDAHSNYDPSNHEKVYDTTWFPPIPEDYVVRITAHHWIHEDCACDNSMGLRNVNWREASPKGTRDNTSKVIPDYNWSMYRPQFDDTGYIHSFVLTNYDENDSLIVEGLSFLPSWYDCEYLDTISFLPPFYDTVLMPGESWTIDVFTVDEFLDGYIYLNYDIYNPEGTEVVLNAWAQHDVTPPFHDVAVGTIAVSSDIVTAGEIVEIDVTAHVHGDYPEIFDVMAYYDGNEIDIQNVGLPMHGDTALVFEWDTYGLTPGDYEISAYADEVEFETDLDDNDLIYGYVTILGDFVCGDADANTVVNILDITYLVSYLYKGGPSPDPLEAADVDSSASINILDITYLIAFLYKGGPAPNCP